MVKVLKVGCKCSSALAAICASLLVTALLAEAGGEGQLGTDISGSLKVPKATRARGVPSTWSHGHVGSTVLGPWSCGMGKEDEMTEVLGSSWKAVPSPLAMVHCELTFSNWC